MHKTIRTMSEFQRAWEGNRNFLLAGECVPFDFAFPPLETLVDILRRDDDVRILRGGRQGVLDASDIKARFRALPLEKAVATPFHLSHFKLANFFGPGQMLHGFEERVLAPWRAFLRKAGFTWERCYPILFLAGPGSGSSYHLDVSHVVAWQIHGTKIFNGLKEPERFSLIAEAVKKEYRDALNKPQSLRGDDVLAYEMKPGAVLWNQLLTPHWVDAGTSAAASLNLSHGMLRQHGKLCPNERRLEAWWDEHPKEAWRRKTAGTPARETAHEFARTD